MAKVWLKDTCAVCGQPLPEDDKTILIATVKLTHEYTYGSSYGDKDQVRPLFHSKSPRVAVHPDCLHPEVRKLLGGRT